MPESRRTIFLAGLVIVLAGLAVYSNSLAGDFIFDDRSAILNNPSIVQGWAEALSPPEGGVAVMGRPLINLSLAFNHWLGGENTRGYHILNLAVHLLGGLTLFGLVRRTLLLPALHGRFGGDALPLAFTIALLWTVHPLQTESVSYIAQRSESMVSLCYLLTLYFFVRGVESARAGWWLGCSVAACLLGVFSKEIIASAPLLTLLYDRALVAGTFKEAWRRRRKYYWALAGTWIPLVALAVNMSMGVEMSMMQGSQLIGAPKLAPGMIWWAYLLKQGEAIVHYLWLAFWPHPLVLDYGLSLVTNPLAVAPQALVLLLLFAATLWALVRRPALGFLGAWFFLILAPSSSIIPLTGEPMAEHRLYLPLAAVLVLAVLGVYAWAGWRSLAAWMFIALGWGALAFARNPDYRGTLIMWTDNVGKSPDNARAVYNLGYTLMYRNRFEEAVGRFRQTLRIDPDYSNAQTNLGSTLTKLGRLEEAVAQFRLVIQARPDSWVDYNNLAVALADSGQKTEAIALYRKILGHQPDYAEAHAGLGNALYETGHGTEAVTEFETALRLDPAKATTHNNLAFALAQQNDWPRALEHFQEALRLNPAFVEAHFNLGMFLFQQNQLPAAVIELEQTVKLRPNFAMAHYHLGRALIQLGHNPEAVLEFAAALHYNPDLADARQALEQIQPPAGR